MATESLSGLKQTVLPDDAIEVGREGLGQGASPQRRARGLVCC